jgi:hypothetical protein
MMELKLISCRTAAQEGAIERFQKATPNKLKIDGKLLACRWRSRGFVT